ncbi:MULTISPECIES: hypothetical protein [Saccharopolyspora]|jgi:hypothetical protein|uniref:Uncharacterized protein n=2 Tax=Saccharopolyspora TaxID=1835 RepID=A0A4R4VNM5_9PSEU|nr:MULTISPECIES: hypothetical protein [Saccharopolyspora]MBQ0924322.1 hypothetical protein [Saccharopolyspora endophytica]TDD07409.1 hypothetical protein E1181_09960 [Saccharopolyspora terrae]
MERIPRQQDTSNLPTVLAEYGHLAAQLPGASTQQAERLRARLAELDEQIDDYVARLTEYHSIVDS